MVPRRRIGTSSLRKGKLFRAASPQYPREAIVSFGAAWLVINSVLLLVLLAELLLGGPGPGPHGRIFGGNFVIKCCRGGPPPAFHQMQALARSLKIGFRTEVGHVDDEGIAL